MRMRWYSIPIVALIALLPGQISLAVAAEPAGTEVKGASSVKTDGAVPVSSPSPSPSPSPSLSPSPAVPAIDGTAAAATIDGIAVTMDELDSALTISARRKFYHGKIDPKQVGPFRRSVLEELIIEHLLLREAKTRGVGPDLVDVETKIAAMEERYKDSAEWKAQRDQVLPPMKERMITNSSKSQLEKKIREVSPPDEAALSDFYSKNMELFTEPVRDRVAVILLKVDPSSTRVVWEQAAAEAARLRAKIASGADFSELAKLHSADPSAEQGGDMGYLHVGRLGAAAHEVMQKMSVGDVTEPIELLEGYGLFRLLDRQVAKVHPLDKVRERAGELYVRNKGEENWTTFSSKLRASAKVWIRPEIASVGADP